MKKQIMIIIYLLLNVPLIYPQNKGTLQRFGIFIGENNGGPNRAKLQYAVSDVKAVAKVFQEMGGVESKNQAVLVNPGKKDLIETINLMQNKLKAMGDTSSRRELIFYYSGHSDDKGIILGKETYSYMDLKTELNKLTVDLTIIILDSCESGAFTRIKGVKKQLPFLTGNSAKMKGYALLTSSSADEVSQESDEIKGSFFTHYFVSGLRGAADTSHDKRITLDEIYQYTYQSTLEKTAATLQGVQHPNYAVQMSGSGSVVITDIRETSAGLRLKKNAQGEYYIYDSNRKLIAEINKLPDEETIIGLESGQYQVALKKGDNYYKGDIKILYNQIKTLDENKLEKEEKIITHSRGGKMQQGSGQSEYTYPLRTLGYVSLGISIASFATGIYFNSLAVKNNKDALEKYDVYMAAESDIDSKWKDYLEAYDLTQQQVQVRNILYISSGVTLAFSAVSLFFIKTKNEHYTAFNILPDRFNFAYRF